MREDGIALTNYILVEAVDKSGILLQCIRQIMLEKGDPGLRLGQRGTIIGFVRSNMRKEILA